MAIQDIENPIIRRTVLILSTPLMFVLLIISLVDPLCDACRVIVKGYSEIFKAILGVFKSVWEGCKEPVI